MIDFHLAKELADIGEKLQDEPGARLIADPTDTLVKEGLIPAGDVKIEDVIEGLRKLYNDHEHERVVEYTDYVYIVTLTVRDDEEPPALGDLARVLYQGIELINTEDAILVERANSAGLTVAIDREELTAERARLSAAFEEAGGRGVDLAERIDEIDHLLGPR